MKMENKCKLIKKGYCTPPTAWFIKINKFFLYCGVMKFLADMPSCLGGEDYGINEA
jgi:hypothetical protein